MKNDLKAKLIELAKGRGVDPSQYASDKELFQAITGINVADEDFLNSAKNLEWYVPGGAVSITTEYESGDVNLDGVVDAADVTEIEENKGTTDPDKIANYDINKDGVVDDADVELANSQITVEEEEEETEVESDSYDYIYDEASWNASYADGALRRYYDANPSEDLWNTTEHRAANFNDRYYEGTVDGANVASKASWVTENAQSVIIDGVTYYMAMFYDFDAKEVELFDDTALTENSNKTFIIESISYTGCTQCWEGAVNAPGAKYPWIAPVFDTDVNATITFQYEGKEDVQPWGNTIFGTGEGHKSWGTASIPTEFNDDSFLVTGDNEFDISKFKMILKKA